MRKLLLVLALLATLPVVAEDHGRHASPPPASNPISLEGEIRSVSSDGGTITIEVIRQRDPIVAYRGTSVKMKDGARIRAADLLPGDSIHVDGDQERGRIVAKAITVLLRPERRP